MHGQPLEAQGVERSRGDRVALRLVGLKVGWPSGGLTVVPSHAARQAMSRYVRAIGQQYR
jgi:hypothetical protein